MSLDDVQKNRPQNIDIDGENVDTMPLAELLKQVLNKLITIETQLMNSTYCIKMM